MQATLWLPRLLLLRGGARLTPPGCRGGRGGQRGGHKAGLAWPTSATALPQQHKSPTHVAPPRHESMHPRVQGKHPAALTTRSRRRQSSSGCRGGPRAPQCSQLRGRGVGPPGSHVRAEHGRGWVGGGWKGQSTRPRERRLAKAARLGVRDPKRLPPAGQAPGAACGPKHQSCRASLAVTPMPARVHSTGDEASYGEAACPAGPFPQPRGACPQPRHVGAPPLRRPRPAPHPTRRCPASP